MVPMLAGIRGLVAVFRPERASCRRFWHSITPVASGLALSRIHGQPRCAQGRHFHTVSPSVRTEEGMELRSIERPRKQRIVVMTVALILAAVAVAGTIRAFRADHRPADERPTVVARIGVAGTPSTIAAGQDAIWVLSAATLYRIDPQTDRVAGAVRIPGGQYGDVAVTHDAVWVMSAGTGTLSRIDPETDRVAGAVRITEQRNPGQDSPVAVTHEAVWVAVFGEIGANGKVKGGSLVRVDPGTMRIAARLPISGIVGLEPGMGSLWANQISAYPSGTPPSPDRPSGSVYRVDPSTDEFHAVLTDAPLSIRMV